MSNQQDTINREDFNKGKLLLSWTFPEFVKYERSKKWYITASSIIILFLLYAVFTFNFLLAVIVVMAVLVVLIREKSDPKNINFSITERGIEIGEKFYTYRDVKKFSIIYEPPNVKVLYLEFKFKMKPRFSVQLENQNPNEVRKVLKEYLDEDLDRESESVSDALGRWLKI